MDMESKDKLTKDILANSKLELTNPDFNNLLMNRIRNERRKQVLVHNIVLYSLIFMSIDAIIFALLKLMNIRITDITIKINSFSHGTSNTKYFLFIYLLAIAFLAIKVFTRTQYRYSKMQD